MRSRLASAYKRLGEEVRKFRCCDTDFRIQATGLRASHAVATARRTAKTLEGQLDAFDETSAISELNDGTARDEHVARLVRRGLDYYDRTDRVFDIHQGRVEHDHQARVEHDLKEFLRGTQQSPPETFETGIVTVDNNYVRTSVPLDLNGLAKANIVDQAAATLDGIGRRGFVGGGGDMSPPTDPVAIESPYGDATPLKTLDTEWNVATSGGYRRERRGTDHIYNPATERLGSRHELVTVVARRDCMEADAVSTTLAALPLDEAESLAEEWLDLEALIVHNGVFHPTENFTNHVLDT